MTNKDLLNLKTGDKIRVKKLDLIFNFNKVENVFEGLLTSKELEKSKSKIMISVRKIKDYDYPKWVTNDIMFLPREIEKIN